MGGSEDDATALVRAIAENSPAMLWMGDAEGKCVFLNGALRRFWGIDPVDLSAFDWSSTLHPDDIEMLSGPFAAAMASHTPFSVQARYRRADGVYRTMRTEASPRLSASGEFLGMTGVNTDVSDQLAAEEHNRLLMGELNHRTKNILTVVQALARQTARNTPPDQFAEAFEARLSGLAASNDLLLKDDWAGVQLNELIKAQLSFIPDLLESRIVTSGSPLRIPSRGAQTLGMALHELSTNSLKYGALSHPDGLVHLSWAGHGPGRWEIEWREESPLPAKAPEHKGFGHRVIVDMVAATFDAEVSVEFAQTGFRWRAVAGAAGT